MTLTLAPHRATTRHLASLYLLQADRHFDGGPLLGLEVRSGATFCFEPFAAYAAGLITNPNLLVLGEVGSGKSTVAKLLSWAEHALLGRSVAILDPKGEYGALARLLGLPSLRLSPGGRARINPLELADSAGIDEHDRRRTDIVSALGESGLGRALRPEERATLDVTLTELSGTPMLGSVVNALLSPSASVAAALHSNVPELASSCRELALSLRRLTDGDLAGMFDGPSTVRLDALSPGIHVDLSAVYGNPSVLAPTMVAAGSWLTATLAVPGRQSVLVLDETWQVLADPGIGRWLRSTMKLARSLGTAVVLVTHALSDFQAVGDERSEAARLAASLVADTASRVLLAHSDAAVGETASLLDLTRAEAEILTHLRRGVGLWHVGEHVALVRHLVPPGLLDAFDTDAEMLGHSPGRSGAGR